MGLLNAFAEFIRDTAEDAMSQTIKESDARGYSDELNQMSAEDQRQWERNQRQRAVANFIDN